MEEFLRPQDVLAAPAALALWQLFERVSGGALPATMLAGYLQTYGLEALRNKVHSAAALVVHLGWTISPVAVVAAFARQLARAYPERATRENQTALTMMVFGMINWTFTWLKPETQTNANSFCWPAKTTSVGSSITTALLR